MADIDIRGRDQGATDILKQIAALAEQVGVKFSSLKQIMSEMDNQGRQTAATLKGIDEAGRNVAVTISGLTSKKDRFRIKTTESTAALKDENKALSDQELIMKQLAQAERQRNEARKVLRSVQRGFTERELFKQDVTPQEFFNLKKAEANLADFVAKNNISAKTVVRIWRDVAANSFKAYRGELAEVQKRTFDLVKAQQAVGASASREMKRAQTATQDASKSVREFTLSWESIKRIIAIQVLRRLLFGLTNQIRQATVQMKEFAKAVAEIRTISQNAQLATEEWERGLTRLSNAFGIDVLDVAEAAYQTLSNQVAEGAETFAFLEQAIRFGIVTQTSATDSVQLLTAAINAYGLSAKDAESVAASFFKTIELGRIRGNELSNTFGRVAILGKQLNIEMSELQAALTVLTRRGIKTSEAMTQLRGFLLKLVKPTTEMKVLLKDLGVESGEAAIEAFGLSGFLQILEKRTSGSSTELAKFVSRIRGLIAAVGLTGDGLEAFRKDQEEIINAQESFQKASEIAFDNIGRKADQTFQELLNTIREDFGKPILEVIVEINASFVKFSAVVKNLATTVALFGGAGLLLRLAAGFKAVALAANAAATATAAAGQAAKTGATIAGLTAGGWLKLAAAIGFIGKSLIDSWIQRQDEAEERSKRFFEATTEAARRQTQKRLKFLDDFNRGLQDTYANVAAEVASVLKEIDESIEDQIDIVKEAAKTFEDAYGEASKVIKNELKDVSDAQKNAIRDIEKISKFTRDFRLEIEETLFARDLELAPNVDAQFSRIETRIDTLRTRLNEAFKAGNVDLIQEIARDLLKLQSELDSLDRKAIEKNEDLVGDLKDERQKAAEELASITRQLAVAQQKNDIQDIEKLKRDRLEVLRDLEKAERDLNNELKKFQSDRLGEYKDEAVATINALYKEIEEKSRDVQNRLADEAIELEAKKQKAARRFELLRLDIRQITQQDIDAQFLQKDEEELNRLFSKRVELIGRVVQELEKAGDVERANLLRDQLKEERTLVTAELEKRVFSEKLADLKTEISIIKEGISLKKEELEVTNRGTEQAQAALQYLLKDLDIRKLIKESNFGFDATISYQEAKILNKILDDATASFEDFINEGIRGEEVRDTLKNLRAELEKAGGVIRGSRALGESYVDNLKDEIRVIEGFIRQGLGRADEIAAAQAEIQKYENQLKSLETEQEALATKGQEANKRTARSFDEISDSIRTATDLLRGLQELAAQGIGAVGLGSQDAFARGGHVASTDTIPALLSRGEFVMNAKSSRQFYSQLVGMNSGFARGGGVSTTNVGDIHIHGFKPSGNDSADVVRLGRQLRREIRRGTVRLS